MADDDWELPQGSKDIRVWGVMTPDGLPVFGMSDAMVADLQAQFGAEAGHWAREVASQAKLLDTPGPDDDGYPRYETPAPVFLNSALVRFEEIGAGKLWAFYPDDPLPPITEV